MFRFQNGTQYYNIVTNSGEIQTLLSGLGGNNQNSAQSQSIVQPQQTPVSQGIQSQQVSTSQSAQVV